MSKTKADFQQLIAAEISNYPTAAQFYQARDPRLLAQLDAIAAMFAMLSAEIEVAAAEPFTKARDATVLADASVKGVLPFGKPTLVKLAVTNANTTPVSITAGRRILDTRGRVFVVQAGATVPGNTTGYVTAYQRLTRTFTHTIEESRPFYTVEVPQPEPGRYFVSVEVRLGTATFAYRPGFVNVAVNELAFHLFSDEQRRLYIEFGAANIAAYQPSTGEVVTVTVFETEGAIELAAGSKFAFEYSSGPLDTRVTLVLDSVLEPGSAPMDTSTMREVVSYPSTYDQSAVYLGNFDFLIRRNMSPLVFLSVWNERLEEAVRGPSEDNINTLFVAARKTGVAQPTLEAQIEKVIMAADDSYRIAHVDIEDVEIPVTIVAKVQDVYDFTAVGQRIRELVLAEYGVDSAWAKRGQSRILKKRIYDILENNIQALQGAGSDLDVMITDPEEDMLPEQFRYVSNDSLTVTVEQAY
jgi:hypothetical protein